MNETRISRKTDGRLQHAALFREIFDDFSPGAERWLFVSPHDDDIVIGAGLLLQQAVAEGIPVSVIITTDGSLGYCEDRQRDSIVEIRKKETLDSFAGLGVDDVSWLGFPDDSLTLYKGRRPAREGDTAVTAGFTGIENSYVHHLRKIKPTRVFLPAGSDYHLDHKVVYEELLISLFHATNRVWPELGDPMSGFPRVYEMAVYCDFSGEPDIQIQAPQEFLEKKLESIEAYHSQKSIIRALVDGLRKEGPVEYFKDIEFSLYQPSKYRTLF